MKSDFDLICRSFPSDIRIYPIADVHYGAISHQRDEWEKFLRDVQAESSAFLLLNGDLINNNTRSSVGSPFEDVVRPRDQKRAMVEYLEPIRDRILCITSGNHERRSLKDCDDDPAYDIACKLDLEDVYRSDAAFLKLCLGQHSHGKKRPDAHAVAYAFAVTHGAGGGIYTGATVNRNERWGNVIDGLDCLVVGHSHKPTVTRPGKIVIDKFNNRVSIQEYLVISCCSWMAYAGYPLQKMMLPSVTAMPQVLHLAAERNKKITVTW